MITAFQISRSVTIFADTTKNYLTNSLILKYFVHDSWFTLSNSLLQSIKVMNRSFLVLFMIKIYVLQSKHRPCDLLVSLTYGMNSLVT